MKARIAWALVACAGHDLADRLAELQPVGAAQPFRRRLDQRLRPHRIVWAREPPVDRHGGALVLDQDVGQRRASSAWSRSTCRRRSGWSSARPATDGAADAAARRRAAPRCRGATAPGSRRSPRPGGRSRSPARRRRGARAASSRISHESGLDDHRVGTRGDLGEGAVEVEEEGDGHRLRSRARISDPRYHGAASRQTAAALPYMVDGALDTGIRMTWPSARPAPDPIGPGEESVWDYPRPPRLEPVAQRLRVMLGAAVIAETEAGFRVLETSPSADLLSAAGLPSWPARSWMGGTAETCEWKGRAMLFDVRGGDHTIPGAAWTYPDPTTGFPRHHRLRRLLCGADGRLLRRTRPGHASARHLLRRLDHARDRRPVQGWSGLDGLVICGVGAPRDPVVKKQGDGMNALTDTDPRAAGFDPAALGRIEPWMDRLVADRAARRPVGHGDAAGPDCLRAGLRPGRSRPGHPVHPRHGGADLLDDQAAHTLWR